MTLTRMIDGAEKRYGSHLFRPIAVLSLGPDAFFGFRGLAEPVRGAAPDRAAVDVALTGLLSPPPPGSAEFVELRLVFVGELLGRQVGARHDLAPHLLE